MGIKELLSPSVFQSKQIADKDPKDMESRMNKIETMLEVKNTAILK